jgi:F-type H+-transporting ATPase subunit a
MVAGHALLKILLLFLLLLLNMTGAAPIIGSFFGFIIILAVVTLELLIAFLQAYVFIFLMLVYTKELL